MVNVGIAKRPLGKCPVTEGGHSTSLVVETNRQGVIHGQAVRVRVLIVGLLCRWRPQRSASTHLALTRASTQLDKTSSFASHDDARHGPAVRLTLLSPSGKAAPRLDDSVKVGLSFAILSLGLTWVPLQGLVGRMRQSRNLARQDVPAPRLRHPRHLWEVPPPRKTTPARSC